MQAQGPDQWLVKQLPVIDFNLEIRGTSHAYTVLYYNLFLQAVR